MDDARGLAGRLSWSGRAPIDLERAVVLTGPELRCRETALQLELAGAETEPWLSDWNTGDWAGRSLDDLAAQEPAAIQQWLQDADFAPPGGQSRRALIERCAAGLEARAASSRVVAVTHPAVLRAVAVHALGAAPASFWRIDVPPLSTLSVSGDPGRWSVRLH